MNPSLPTRVVLWSFTVAALGFFICPIVVVVGSSLTSTGYLTFPPRGFSVEWYREALGDPRYLRPILISLALAAGTATTSTIVGIGASIALERLRFRGRDALRALLSGPLVIPQVMIGAALLQFLAVIGIVRGTTALFIGHVVIALPFVIRAVEGPLSQIGERLEDASRDLQATMFETLRFVTLPLIRAGVIAGWLLAFIISWINVEISLFLMPLFDSTMPVTIFNYVQYGIDPLIAAFASISIAISVVLIVLIDALFGIEQVTLSKNGE